MPISAVYPQRYPGYHVTMGLGDAVATEPQWLFRPTVAKIPARTLGVVLCHAAQGTLADEFVSVPTSRATVIAAALARRGIPMISGAFGFESWGNDASMTKVTSTGAYMSTSFGTHPTRWHLIGISMGACTALRYAALNPTKVASVTTILPVNDIITGYQNNVAGLRASIGTAWGVTYPTALPGPADFANLLPPLLLAANMPGRMYYSSIDALVPAAGVRAFAAAAGWTATIIDSTLGHGDAGLVNTPVESIADYILSLS